ncbi:DUF4873 domain-containing protein [Williamsia sp.]|uniref:DUF4873 domain-containing protein n=1 Tax=Williamsia sp. TaxID=1872085 RepID=UPI002F93A536
MSALRVGLVGSGPAISRMAARLQRSPGEIEISDVAEVGEFDAICDQWNNSERSHVLITDGAAPEGSYLGVACSRQANLFHVGSTDSPMVDHVGAAIDEMVLSGATRVAVRVPIERSWAGYVRAKGGGRKLIRKLTRFDASDYDYSSAELRDEGVYDGPAIIDHDGDEIAARIRVQGYIDPVDGQFHWAGIAFGDEVRALKDARASSVEIWVDGGESMPARLAEVTPWGTVRITGTGTPPYPLEDAELLVRG